jgi:hypothetical protein
MFSHVRNYVGSIGGDYTLMANDSTPNDILLHISVRNYNRGHSALFT